MPSTVNRMSFGMRNEFRARFERQLRCAAKWRSTIHTLDLVEAKGDADVVSAHSVGIVLASRANAFQSGMGTAEPMHPIWRTPSDRPVASIAGAMSVGAT